MSLHEPLKRETVRIFRFVNGNQGNFRLEFEGSLVVHESTGWWPRMNMCSHKPLIEDTYRWVEYQGQRYHLAKDNAIALASDDVPEPATVYNAGMQVGLAMAAQAAREYVKCEPGGTISGATASLIASRIEAIAEEKSGGR